ncbi:3-hydroxyacyl-CoA dehydrogenase NAD-binding domain-containing protein [Kushneria marisflavi]|uniref:L-carnitine dehydrogenase n=1 Tax=Kushneria marisflavi TaxID=157779 RepID=A0A240UR54_9GAMM|nr:3-hydroxyacyl-CoA dehydrogenase NAD-binding domain-containing protein [Kushneria marisflavi]ART63958.1 3-hydroxybutyryl-CoA dehydrogenase [Kushneria marisflavi]RKD85680.1 carnitine 3-dehydrogenase [Kushneria marisflavi]
MKAESSQKVMAVIGCGVIGSGWVARALAAGMQVQAWDPNPEAITGLQNNIDTAWPALVRRGLAEGASRDHLHFSTDLDEVLEGADLVQENAPERLEIKQSLLASIDARVPNHVLIGSSTSGIKPSELQAQCHRAPGRVIVAHPFNPVYLLPLVELVGGQHTDPALMVSARAQYEQLGMRPLIVRREIEGHIADRLMEALWREALHLVNDGVATTEEVDAAIVYGAGLRWSLMGTFLTFHLAGGEGGMRHMLEQFGPALKQPWTRLEAPELTPELIERVASGSEFQAGGRSIATLEARRDRFLGELLEVVERYWPEQEGLGGRI